MSLAGEPPRQPPATPRVQVARHSTWVAIHWRDSATVPLSAAALLDRHEIARYRAIKHGGDARDYLAAHVAAREAIGAYLGIHPQHVEFIRTYRRGRTTKPLIGGARVDFSLSHSRGLGIVALGEAGLVGVDCEPRTRPYHDRLFSRILADSELREVSETGDAQRTREMMLTLWTRKEAALKALGVGLSIDPRNVVVEPDSVRLALHRSGETRVAMRTRSFAVGTQHICAVATTSSGSDLQFKTIDVATLRISTDDVTGSKSQERA